MTQKYHTKIVPAEGWVPLDLHEVWAYRDLVRFLITRDLKVRYRQMALGPLWIIIQPISRIVIFTFIFGIIANLPSDDLPYPLFSYSGLLPWGYFAAVAAGSMASLNNYMGMMSKVYFPRLIAPIASMLSSLVDTTISFAVFLLLMLFYGYVPHLTTLLIPLYAILAAMTGLSIGLWSAAITVRYRDVQIIVSYGIQFMLYATPVTYAASLIPEQWLGLYKLNPMYWVVEGFRWCLLGTGTPPQVEMIIPFAVVLVLLISGLFVFRRTEVNIVDVL